MVFGYNPNDPMCRSVYMEMPVPTIEEIVTGQTPNPLQYATPINPNGPRLAPQPTRDGYYTSDGVDDGRISTFEKVKAFVKGGTYNMVRGLFCDKNGFSLGRTLMSAAGAAAIAFTGPVGMLAASGLGLICAVDNFNNSRHKAKFAVTDQQAREAFEGFGESAATAGLSIWGGWKGLKGIKAKFFKPKAAKPKPNTPAGGQPAQPAQPAPAPQVNQPANPAPAPQGGTPPASTPAPQGAPNTPPTSQPNSAGGTAAASANIGEINAEGFFNEWAPTGDIPVQKPATAKVTTHEYVADWKPTGDIPKGTTHPYTNEWAPTGDVPKPTSHPYTSGWAPTGDVPKPRYTYAEPAIEVTEPTSFKVPSNATPSADVLADAVPVKPTIAGKIAPNADITSTANIRPAPQPPNVDAVIDNNNHFFG